MSESEPLPTPDPTQPAMDQILQDNIKTPRRWMGLHIAQTAGLVQDALAIAEFDRQKQREAWEFQKQLYGMTSTNVPQTSGEDVGNITVGDTHYHMSATAQQANAMSSDGNTTTAQPADTKPSTASKVGNVAKWAAIAAALAGSGAGGAGLTAYLLKPSAPAVVQDAAAKYLNDGEIFQVVPTESK